MSWVKDALAGLKEMQTVVVQPFGGSMRGRIESGQLVTLEPAHHDRLAVDDAVFVAWGSNYLLHLIKEIRDDRILIGNNLGKINGWVPIGAVLGKVIEVRDEEIAIGTAIEPATHLSWVVQLDGGSTVEAQIPKKLASHLGVIYADDRLRIGGIWNGEYRIIGFDSHATTRTSQ